MPKKNDIPLKEKFRLWWDFLHGSDKFRQYRDKKIKAQKEWDRKKIYWEIPQKFLSFVLPTKIRGKSISNLYGYFIPIDERPFSKEERQSFLRGFYIWGDIFDRSFEEWWGKYPKNTNVMDYCERIGFDMEFVTELFKQKRKRNPSLNEFKKAFLSFLKKRGESFIVVNPHLNFSFERDGHLIKEIIKKKKKASKGYSEGWIMPTEPFFFDDVKRYLKVYDLKKQNNPRLKWREIAAKIYPNLKFSESLKRTLQLDNSKAKRIIKNVEKGLFPSHY